LNLIDKVKSILLNELNLDMIEDDARQEDYSEWDSLTYLRILAAFEAEFNIQITPENINEFNSIPNIVEEITKCQKQ
jgi:acyl carrier protein